MEKQKEGKKTPVLTSRDAKRENSKWSRPSSELSRREIFQYIFSDFFRYGYFVLAIFFDVVIILFQTIYSLSPLFSIGVLPFPYSQSFSIFELFLGLILIVIETFLVKLEISFYKNYLKKKIYGI
ncbi:MAG: hypothetical protein ACYCR8_03800 [Cuniculiplasma sp.]|jgi:hypothetical protein